MKACIPVDSFRYISHNGFRSQWKLCVVTIVRFYTKAILRLNERALYTTPICFKHNVGTVSRRLDLCF